MTDFGLRFLSYKETKRNNIAREMEEQRHHKQEELETATWHRNTEFETNRHQTQEEKEKHRANVEGEQEKAFNNAITEYLSMSKDKIKHVVDAYGFDVKTAESIVKAAEDHFKNYMGAVKDTAGIKVDGLGIDASAWIGLISYALSERGEPNAVKTWEEMAPNVRKELVAKIEKALSIDGMLAYARKRMEAKSHLSK